MDKLFFSAIIGLIAGVIDIIPMIMQKLPRYSTVSALSLIHISEPTRP